MTFSETDQWLYRIYDVESSLLYVGITKHGMGRFDRHGRERSWWRDVVWITVEHFPDRLAVEQAELEAIRREKPRYNIAGKPVVWRPAEPMPLRRPVVEAPPVKLPPFVYDDAEGADDEVTIGYDVAIGVATRLLQEACPDNPLAGVIIQGLGRKLEREAVVR